MPETLTITRDWFAMLESLPTVQSRWNVLYAVARFAFDGVKPDGLDTLEKSVFMNIKNAILNRRRRLRNYRKNKKNHYNVTLQCNGQESSSKHYNVTLQCNGSEQTEFSFNTVDSHGNLKKDNTLDSSRDIKESVGKKDLMPETRKRRIFVKPTLDDVAEYCRQRGNNIDPEEFMAYYESKGWVVGKNAPMKSWKSAVQLWERMAYKRQRERYAPPQRDYSGI